MLLNILSLRSSIFDNELEFRSSDFVFRLKKLNLFLFFHYDLPFVSENRKDN